MSGNGQEHLARVLARLSIPESGLVEPQHLTAAYIPEDRATEGLALAATVADNAIARQYRNMSHPTTGWLGQRRVGPFVKSVLDRFQVRVEVLPPGEGPALFDSDAPGATPPFVLDELSALLLPGETLTLGTMKLEFKGAKAERVESVKQATVYAAAGKCTISYPGTGTLEVEVGGD